jgi:hypothetical protein
MNIIKHTTELKKNIARKDRPTAPHMVHAWKHPSSPFPMQFRLG